MPGSPPMRMRLPGTMPPPSTRSNSVTPEETRASSCDSISPKRTGFTSRRWTEARAAIPFAAPAEHAVELRHARRDARVVLRLDLAEADGLHLAQMDGGARRHPLRSPRGPRALFDERTPLAAVGTLPQPLALLMAALLTDVNGRRCFRHFPHPARGLQSHSDGRLGAPKINF